MTSIEKENKMTSILFKLLSPYNSQINTFNIFKQQIISLINSLKRHLSQIQ
jgi:hypothetical protein